MPAGIRMKERAPELKHLSSKITNACLEMSGRWGPSSGKQTPSVHGSSKPATNDDFLWVAVTRDRSEGDVVAARRWLFAYCSGPSPMPNVSTLQRLRVLGNRRPNRMSLKGWM